MAQEDFEADELFPWTQLGFKQHDADFSPHSNGWEISEN